MSFSFLGCISTDSIIFIISAFRPLFTYKKLCKDSWDGFLSKVRDTAHAYHYIHLWQKIWIFLKDKNIDYGGWLHQVVVQQIQVAEQRPFFKILSSKLYTARTSSFILELLQISMYTFKGKPLKLIGKPHSTNQNKVVGLNLIYWSTKISYLFEFSLFVDSTFMAYECHKSQYLVLLPKNRRRINIKDQ